MSCASLCGVFYTVETDTKNRLPLGSVPIISVLVSVSGTVKCKHTIYIDLEKREVKLVFDSHVLYLKGYPQAGKPFAPYPSCPGIVSLDVSP